eukprot:s1782_g24.t1
MPWRKQTLTPFRSGNSSVNAGSSDDSASIRSFGDYSEVPSRLFGNSEPDLDWELVGTSNGACQHDSRSSESAVQGPEHTVSKAHFDRMVGNSFLSVANAADIQMPWEKGIFKQIFGDDTALPKFDMMWIPNKDEFSGPPEDTAKGLAAASVLHSSGAGPIHLHAISCISDLDFDGKQSELQRVACHKWLSILQLCLSASDVGRNIAELDVDDSQSEALNIIAAVIGVRSFHTAICRANAVLRYLRFALSECPKQKLCFGSIFNT